MSLFSLSNNPCSEVYLTLPNMFMFYNSGLYFLAYGIKTEPCFLCSEMVKKLSRPTKMKDSGEQIKA